jgi:hypothetical protein
LLAYLDDTLDSSQVKQIGQKVAESDTAQELIARIKQVTRRRRLTTPPVGGPGTKIDPNLIAEYLDNKLSEDDVAEVEQICLGSDVHLAEVAACHQILTLVMGEPILIPPTSRQRMYGLVKGREAIPFRRPPAEDRVEREREESYETDETLRLGLPALRRGSWTSRLILIGGGLAVCALLALVVIQALQLGALRSKEDNTALASGQEKKATEQQGQGPAANQETKPEGSAQQGQTSKETQQTRPGTGKETTRKETGSGSQGQNPSGTGKRVPSEKTPPGKPSNDVVPVADFVQLDDPQDPALLLQYDSKKKTWRRLDSHNSKVMTGERLVSLPGFQSVVDTESGVRLILWGQQPEMSFYVMPTIEKRLGPDGKVTDVKVQSVQLPRTTESMVELHRNDEFSLDLTLLRGRVVLQNRQGKPIHVRVRFHNPTKPFKDGVWDLTLPDKGTDVLLERWSDQNPGEPFYADATNPDRIGPIAYVRAIVRKGSVEVLERDLPITLKAPPGKSWLVWNSRQGTAAPIMLQVLPDYATGEANMTKLPEEQRKELIDIKRQIRLVEEEMASKMAMLNVDAVLTDFLKSDNGFKILLALRCYAALDDLPALIDAAGIDEPQRGGIRIKAIGNLHRWLENERENDARLYQAFRDEKFSDLEAQDAMTMLHGFSSRDVVEAATYKTLINYLGSPKAALREMAAQALYFQLRSVFPKELQEEVYNIPYSASAPPEVRQKAQEAWNALLERGKLPPKLKAPG